MAGSIWSAFLAARGLVVHKQESGWCFHDNFRYVFCSICVLGVANCLSGIIYLLYTIPILEWLSPFALSELRISRLCIFLATAIASLAVFAVIGMLAVMVGRSYFFYFQDEYGRRGIIPKLELPQ